MGYDLHDEYDDKQAAEELLACRRMTGLAELLSIRWGRRYEAGTRTAVAFSATWIWRGGYLGVTIAEIRLKSDFNIDDIRRILESCPEYEDGHHLDRPFMSAYQIAIRFAEEYPNHRLVHGLPLGGEGTGTNQSLAQHIARFLSRAIRDGTAGGIEGGFISHADIEEFSFRHQDGPVRVSTLRSTHADSIFRVRRTASARSS